MLTSLSNPLIKLARSLRQKKYRSESGLFLVEGIHHVGEVVEAGWDIQTVLYAPDLLTSDFAVNLVNQLVRNQVNIQPVTPSVMNSLAEKDNPVGILALVHQRNLSLQQHPPRDVSSAVALVSPQDAGNVGSILRTMDAVGLDVLFLIDGGVDAYHPTVIRASMGAFFWKKINTTTFDDFVAWAHQSGARILGTSAHAKMDYRAVNIFKPWVLVLGSEQKGLSTEQQAACEMIISLPMRGRTSSLNLSVAAGILLYEWLK